MQVQLIFSGIKRVARSLWARFETWQANINRAAELNRLSVSNSFQLIIYYRSYKEQPGLYAGLFFVLVKLSFNEVNQTANIERLLLEDRR